MFEFICIFLVSEVWAGENIRDWEETSEGIGMWMLELDKLVWLIRGDDVEC